jgi:hypothetical protein
MATPRGYLGTAVLPLVLAATGCSGPNDTEGTERLARFAYGDSCVFGCALDHAMMIGTSETIAVRPDLGGGIPGLTAMTDDPSVAFIVRTGRTCVTSSPTETRYDPGDLRTPCTPSQDTGLVTVVAGFRGKTTLRLLRLDGALFDSVSLEVAAPARVAIACNGSSSGSSHSVSSISMSVGETCWVTPTAFDANDAPLQATRGIQVASTNPSAFKFWYDDGVFRGLAQQLFAVGAGDGLLAASVGELRAEVPVHVVDNRPKD